MKFDHIYDGVEFPLRINEEEFAAVFGLVYPIVLDCRWVTVVRFPHRECVRT